MNTFYTHIQPNIIKFSDNEELPESLRCHFAINYNVWGIDYFYENYLLQESDDGAYLLLDENRFNFLLEDSLSGQDIIDIPRIYILITDEFMNDSSLFQQFVIEGAKNSAVYGNGIPGFRPGKQYYLNTTLFNYLANSNLIELTDPDTTDNESDEEYSNYNPVNNRLPNFIDEYGNITKYFVDLSGELIKDYTNLEYFNKKNILVNNHYSEDELRNFYSGLCNIILENTEIEKNVEIYNKQKNQKYDLVIKYFANSQVDNTSIALNLILNSSYNTITTTNNINCGCQNNINDASLSQPCSSLYSQAMILYLQEMFGDPEFYEDWFCIYLSETDRIGNDVLIENLQLFIKEFITLDLNLDFTSTKTYQCDCDVTTLNNSSYQYKKITNFLTILDWVNNQQIEANENKIKVYGKGFGELLPKLQF